MCFVKSPAPAPVVAQEPEPIVQRKEADASMTKNSSINKQRAASAQNIATSPVGLSEDATVQKKTLLGE